MADMAWLAPEEFESAGFLALLREAAGLPDEALREIARTELPRMHVLGSVHGFIAFHDAAEGTEVEYLAVDPAMRGRGLGAALIGAARTHRPDRPVVLETDDDAVAFYRRLGFSVTDREPDPRWPERRRYRCRLPPASR